MSTLASHHEPRRLAPDEPWATRWRFTSGLVKAYLTTNRSYWCFVAVFAVFFAWYVPAFLAMLDRSPWWGIPVGAGFGGAIPPFILAVTTYRDTRKYPQHPDKDAWLLTSADGGVAGGFTRPDKRRGQLPDDVFGASLFAYPTGTKLGRQLNAAVRAHVHAQSPDHRLTGTATFGMKQTYLTTWDCYDDSDGRWWRSRRIASRPRPSGEEGGVGHDDQR